MIIEGDVLVALEKDEMYCDTIEIPSYVRKIGKGVFKNTIINEVVIPASVEEIDDEAFLDACISKSINLPQGIKKIGKKALSTILGTVTVPKDVNKKYEKILKQNSIYNLIVMPNKFERLKGDFSFIPSTTMGLKRSLLLDNNSLIAIEQAPLVDLIDQLKQNKGELFIDFQKLSIKNIQFFIDRNMKNLSSFDSININYDATHLDDESISKLKGTIAYFTQKGYDISVSLFKPQRKDIKGQVFYVYNDKEFSKLDNLNDFSLRLTGKELFYQEVQNHMSDKAKWTHFQVMKANQSLNKIVDKIRKIDPPLSPLETMMLVHDFATNFAYNSKDEETTDHEQYSTIMSSLIKLNPQERQNIKIVCVGYASLVKAIVDKLDMKGLQCEMSLCAIKDNGEKTERRSPHMNNLVYIDDKKYDKKGYYIEDACHDATFEFGKAGFAHCLQTFESLKKIKHHKTEFTTGLNLNTATIGFFPQDELIEHYSIDDYAKKENLLLGQEILIPEYREAYMTILTRLGKSPEVAYSQARNMMIKTIQMNNYLKYELAGFKSVERDESIDIRDEAFFYCKLFNNLLIMLDESKKPGADKNKYYSQFVDIYKRYIKVLSTEQKAAISTRIKELESELFIDNNDKSIGA